MLRSGGTVSKNKTQTVSVSNLVRIIIKFLLFNDLRSYISLHILTVIYVVYYETSLQAQ